MKAKLLITSGMLLLLSAFCFAQTKITPVPPVAIMSPSITLTMSPNVTICTGESTTITVSAASNSPAPYTYAWSPAASLSNPTITNPVASPTVTTVYSCYVTATPSASTGTVVVTVNSCTGVPKINAETEFIIYPNPTSGNITVKSEKEEVRGIEVYNMLGEKVYEETPKLKSGNTFSIIIPSGMEQGIYFVRIKTEQGAIVKKIILNK